MYTRTHARVGRCTRARGRADWDCKSALLCCACGLGSMQRARTALVASRARHTQRVYVLLKTPHSAQLSKPFVCLLGFSGEHGRSLQRAVMAGTLR